MDMRRVPTFAVNAAPARVNHGRVRAGGRRKDSVLEVYYAGYAPALRQAAANAGVRLLRGIRRMQLADLAVGAEAAEGGVPTLLVAAVTLMVDARPPLACDELQSSATTCQVATHRY